MRNRWKAPLIALCATAVFGTAVIAGLDRLDRAFPPPLAMPETSIEVVDRDGELLRALATREGAWRFQVELGDVDPQFLAMLVAYEDRRFYQHHGIDLAAVARAGWQLVANGRIVSGASTITMQLARLVEPRTERSVVAKLRQMVRAIQIERRLTKDEILERYLTLAPYGGNLEGIRAATLAWFGKEPKRLAPGEAALLVSLPQLPERRRPDRHHDAAIKARDRVLDRMRDAGAIAMLDIERGRAASVPSSRRPIPFLAAHAAERALRERRYQLTLKRPVQERLEQVARDAAERLGPKISIAMVLADASTGDIVAEVGSANFFDNARAGWIDMSRAVRSPGSTLKPFIYGLAIEQGMVAQETIIEDRPSNFAGYRPRNFDLAYQGDVSIRTALQMSLNVPAVRLLDAVGPARLTTRFRHAGVSAVLPRDETPGLAIALGGVGITLHDLVQLYTGLANRGTATTIADWSGERTTAALLTPQAAWQVADMLAGVVPPEGAAPRGIAYKTGTSYGYRDAWSIGFDGRHVLGVWAGRADGSAIPGLPVTLQRFRTAQDELKPHGVAEPAPQIVYPPDGARVELTSGERAMPLVLKLQGGRAPFRWLANGRPVEGLSRRRTSQWQPDGAGFSRLTVIDAAGRSASVGVYLDALSP
jgi:penicillin-binding protein 1C